MNRGVKAAMENPRAGLRMLERIECEERLLPFMRRGWHALEPGTPFVDGWAVGAICEHLEGVSMGQITRLLINVPPGCTKSMTVNVFWPAWEWGPRGRPDLRYISASYGQDLSIRDNMRCRDLMLSEWYQGHWPIRFKSDQNAKIKYETEKAGWRLASSVGAQLVGHRGDRIIIDDPHSTMEAESEQIREGTRRWFGETVPTRLNKLGESAIIVIMQRLHTRDVSGQILEKAQELGYVHLCLPMFYEPDHPHPSTRFKDPRTVPGQNLWPERFPDKELDKLRTQFRQVGGTYAEAGQLQQRPVPRGGGLFKESWWRRYKVVPAGGADVRGWDLAATEGGGKYTVGARIKKVGGAYYITDIRRGQWGPAKVKAEIRRAAEDDGHSVDQDFPQDPGQAGKAQVLDFVQALDGYVARSSPESGDKETRALPLAAQCEAGNVYLPESAPWVDEFIKEASLFPVGEYTDQIDACSRAYHRLLTKREDVVPSAGRLIGAD